VGVRAAAGDLVELDGNDTGDVGLRLVGGFSPTSGRHHFPLSQLCPYTGADDVERVLLSDRGTLWGWTTVTVAPPGYRGEVPYGFGIVELTEERLLVVSRLTEADPANLSLGTPMRLVADTVFTDDDGDHVVTWAFAPAS
jgi:uncharacterized OB-fold protein